MRTFSFHTTLDREAGEIEVEVTYSAEPYRAATFYNPAEGGDVELLSVKDGAGFEITTSAAEDTLLLRECMDRFDADFADEEAVRGDMLCDWSDEDEMEGW